MRRIVTLVILLITSVSTLLAQQLSADASLSKAMSQNSQSAILKKGGAEDNLRLQHTAVSKESERTLYYVFGSADGGYVITSGDEVMPAILGYCDNGSWDESLSIPAFREWKEMMEEQMEFAIMFPDIAQEAISHALQAAPTGTVEPLLGNIKWDQNDPYNSLMPLDANGKHCATGCSVTAATQIMRFYKYPTQGQGSKDYYTDTNKYHLTANFAASKYDWANMLPSYNSSYTTTQKNAVSKLAYDFAVAIETDFKSADASSGSITDVVKALANNFKYRKDITLCYRSYFTSDEWQNMIVTELKAKHPVYMRGKNIETNGGHAYVVDGYNNGLYHVNWGWNGSSNGYFLIDKLFPEVQGAGGSNGGYNCDNAIIKGLQPDTNGSSQEDYLITCEGVVINDNTVSFRLSNYGLKSYSGKVGFAIESNGTTRYSTLMLDGLDFCYSSTISASASQLAITKSGAKVYPVYYEGTTAKPMRVAINGYSYATSRLSGTKVVFDAPANEEVKIVPTSLKPHHALYNNTSVALDVELKNMGKEEYNRSLYINVKSSAGTSVMQLKAMDFIYPGETKTVTFRNSKSLAKGTYTAEVYGFKDYSTEVKLGSYTFTVTDPVEPSLSYSGFKISSTKVAKGDILTGDFSVRNTGGYTECYYIMFIFPSTGGTSVAYARIKNAEVNEYSTTPIKLNYAVDLEPGTYYARFKEQNSNQYISNDRFSFTVVEKTDAIDAVTTDSNAENGTRKVMENGKIVIMKGSEKYNLMGGKIE